jgi:hypothetical protein
MVDTDPEVDRDHGTTRARRAEGRNPREGVAASCIARIPVALLA